MLVKYKVIMDEYLEFESGSESSLNSNNNDENIIKKTVDFDLKMMMNSGHKGLIRSIKLDPSKNCKYYLTGSDDTTIRIWSTNKLRDINSESKHYQTSLKGGHKMPVTDLLINSLQPNEIFSCSEDKLALKWDLNKRKITNQFFGHSSSIRTITDHPSIRDLIFTGSKDKTCKMWDSRARSRELLSLTGHKDTVNKVLSFSTEPQVVTCSNDKTIRFYDLRQTGKCTKIISYHSNPIRAMCKGSILEGDAFITASVNQVFSWDATEGIPLTEFEIDTTIEDTGIINSLDIINEGNHLLMNTNNGFKLFDYFSGKRLDLNLNNDNDVDSNVVTTAYNQNLKFNNEDDKTVLISSLDKNLKIYTV